MLGTMIRSQTDNMNIILFIQRVSELKALEGNAQEGLLALTHTEDVKAEALLNGSVDKLIRQTLKTNVATHSQGTNSFSFLKENKLRATIKIT